MNRATRSVLHGLTAPHRHSSPRTPHIFTKRNYLLSGDDSLNQSTTTINARTEPTITSEHPNSNAFKIWPTITSQPPREIIKPEKRSRIYIDTENTSVALREALLSSELKKAWTAYRLLPASECLLLTHEDHSTLLGLLTAHTHSTIAEAHSVTVIFRMREHDIHLDIRDYHNLMRIYLANNNEAKMLDAMKTMQKVDGVQPDLICYNLLMALYAKSIPRRLDMLTNTWIESLRQMPWARLANMDGWAILIDGYARGGDVEGAEKMYEHVKSKAESAGMEIPAHVHEAAIRMYGLAGKLTDASRVFDFVLRREGPSTQSKTVGSAYQGVNEHLYDAMIEACQACNNLGLATMYFKQVMDMCDQWDEWWTASYLNRHSLITRGVLSLPIKLTPVYDRFKRRDGSNFISDNENRGHLCLLIELYQNQSKENFPRNRAYPLSITFDRMICLAAQANDSRLAFEYLCMHIAHNKPEDISFEYVIRMYIRMGNIDAAHQVYRAMAYFGFRPSVEIAAAITSYGPLDPNAPTTF
ncbi:hypothetical protein O5D80_006866 [Batrachochytrium dendrobatidis]|nr:hypothetical protein O5D80_006866 [Batrachochytrium dendrobatidis]